jgi:hypothetical protein
MNWDAIGAVGESLGAVAVFVTLVYLSIQIRQNTKSERASALDASITAFSAIRESTYVNPELSALYMKGSKSPATLSEEEAFRYRLFMHNILLSFWHMFTQSRYGDLPVDIWEAQKPMIARVVSSPGGKWFWKRYKVEFEVTFREEIENIIDKIS